ncbi:hypothetical protein YA0002_20355 [Pseudomonas cichorii]|uniref:dermonecrotic toxin domain-containing protein n=1 Tax=Pseudomonas cichorii TaxID=36746 RepID=UPI0018E60FCD|nr:DUF6543 domain-containing protein [Pseudomonas cichorii]MBI6855110.1 hypothetical protein [Pseudomonas cichorii]
MSVTPYFHSEALRQRFQRNLRIAQTERRITDEEFRYLQHLSDTEQSVVEPRGSVELYRPLLEDGSPEPLAMVTTVVIERWVADVLYLYADTLTDGLMRFADRKQLRDYAKEAFSIAVAQRPAFELQRVEGALFEQRMWQVIDHQAQSLRWLAADLQELPSLSQVLGRLLASRLGDVWADAGLDLHAPLVQVVEQTGGRYVASREHCVRIQSFEQLALDLLTGKALPNGQRYRFMGSSGQLLESIGMSDLDLHMADLEDDYEDLIGHYWNHADAHGLTRRHRFAQALADAFSHRVWMLQQTAPSTKVLARIAASPLYKLSPVPVSRLSLTVDGRGPYKLAGLYLIHLEQGTYALYSPLKGVRQLKDRQALVDLFNSPAGRSELRHYLSLNDQAELSTLETAVGLQVHDYQVDKPLFFDCIDGIIGLQERSLAEALKRHCQDEGELKAMLDDALDVRALLDERLPYIDIGGRWLNEPTHFLASWPPTAVASPAPSSPTVVPAPSWGEKLSRIENTLREISDRRPSMEMFVRQALSPYLAALGYPRPHEGQNIRLIWNEQGVCEGSDVRVHCESPQTHGLTDLVIERFSGVRSRPIPPNSRIQVPAEHGGGDGVGALPVPLLETIVDRVATALQASCTAGFKAFYDWPLRIAHAQRQVSRTLHTSGEQMLRLELALARRHKAIATSLLDLLQDVLDRPLRETRPGSADVQGITLRLSGRRFPLGLNVVWVLQVPDQAQQLLFWSSFTGLLAMDSRVALEGWLQRHLADPEWRSRWLEVFVDQDRQWVDEVLAAGAIVALSLERVDGDFLRLVQHDARQGQSSEFAAALLDARQHRMAAMSVKGSMDMSGNNDWLLTWIDCLSIRVQGLLFMNSMPNWVRHASLEDLARYLELAKNYSRTLDSASDFLAGVPAMQLFARPRLLEALHRDFPGYDLDPDRITVTMIVYEPWSVMVGTGNLPPSLPAGTQVYSESLVDYSLNHFSLIQEGVSSVGLPAGRPLPAGLDATYVARLVHELDIGQHYRKLLSERFDPATPEYASRRESFMQQIPSLLLVAAIELKMQGIISQKAFDYLENVLDMPDGMAREPVDGQQIVMRPLTLVPRKGMAADSVDGFYLFGPKDLKQGPLLLHVQFSEPFTLKEFRDRDHLLAELRTKGALQDLLLSRLKPRLRDRYGNDGLNQAHIALPVWGPDSIFDTTLERPEKVSLGTDIVEGNAMRHQFEAVVKVMHGLSRTHAVTSAEADWAQFIHLTELFSNALMFFVPARLGALIAIWQGEELLTHSISAVLEQQWGVALSDFTLGLGMLVSTRRMEVQPMRMWFRARSSRFLWRSSASPAVLQRHLSKFEEFDVDLATLRHDALRNVYEDSRTRRLYAVLEGKVYRVEHVDSVWRIKGKAGQGPDLRLDAQQKWQLDLDPGLGGSLRSSNPIDREINGVIEEFVRVRADGMKNIRLYSREEARKITMARVHALGYLKNALFNLNAPTAEGVSESVQLALKSFFGVDKATPWMINSVRQRFTELYEGLLQPSLAPLSSSRFVLGRTRSGHESVSAFVVVGDPRKRIILAEDFFSPPSYSLKVVLPGNRAFNAADHYRASTLIHEISHQACDAVDFAYLKAAAPPTEMIDVGQPAWGLYQRQLQVTRDRSLSHLTPKGRLFRVPGENGMRDLRPEDGRLFMKMSSLTGQTSAKEAREIFLSDPQVRSRVILSNADSITMLVSLLGRERFS